MAEEIGTRIFGGSEWWDPARMMPFMNPSSAQFCPAAEFNDIHAGNFGRSLNFYRENIGSRSCEKTTADAAARVSGNDFNLDSADFQIMDSSTTSIWSYCSSGRGKENGNIDSIHHEEMCSSGILDWCPKSFPRTGILGEASTDVFKHINQHISNSPDQPEPTMCTSPTCQQGFCTHAFPFGYSPSTTQSIMESEEIIPNQSSIMEFQYPLFKPSLITSSNQSPTSFPMIPNMSSQQGSFQVSFSPSNLAMPLLGDAVAPKIDIFMKLNNEGIRDMATTIEGGERGSVYKRPRIETPLPTFKVRKEKLGDRVTALQQLVSPFGKNDTASVLHEAVEYIKFLHDQINALINQHLLQTGVCKQNTHQVCDKFKGGEGSPKEDLISRGLCLVPISTTYAVVNETAGDHVWMPKLLGGTFL
ncbi:hypothetical protein SAY87_022324 [Trapa incisa]|uniref:BHLH domain-containing protein n=1 Tax=Trapa incisa TaxID=236973 RepID=A0AAN7K0U0_9MYRT|nr:hypothetical protein SAY87_022324 [Trapa incisa]